MLWAMCDVPFCAFKWNGGEIRLRVVELEVTQRFIQEML